MRSIKRLGVPDEVVINKIFLVRGIKVMLDSDLAELYGVETKHLKRAVRRNKDRFPEDFLIELTPTEFENLRCQFGTSSWGGGRYLPMAFTEQGVAIKGGVEIQPRKNEYWCAWCASLLFMGSHSQPSWRY